MDEKTHRSRHSQADPAGHRNVEANRDRGIERRSEALGQLRIAIGVCGGIGSVETVKIIRELRRHGAELTPFVTPMVETFINPMTLEWAADRPVVGSLGAGVEYLDPFDLVVVAPATLNTISKAALGLSDNPVTLLIASQLGSGRPVLFVPTMNVQLLKHPSYEQHKQTLENWGARFYPAEVDEDRFKMPAPEALAEVVKESFESRATTH